MKKLLFTLIVSMLFLAAICQDTKPVAATLKQVQSPQFWYNTADSSIWVYKGVPYAWTQLQRVNKKYPIWNHTGITNTGWADGKVLGFNSSGNVVPLAASSGGATNLTYTASATNGIVVSDTGTDATIPAGSTTNASLMLPADKTKLDGIDTQADKYSKWYLRTSHGYTGIFSSDYLDFVAGSGVTIADNVTAGSRTITFSSTGSMTYPGAGLAKSTGSGWTTSVTDNSANWNTAYGWGNHAGLYTPLAHKTTEDALNGLVKVNGAGGYSAVTDNSTNWNSAYTNMGKVLVNGLTVYYNLSDVYFVEEYGLIRPNFGSISYANLLPVTGGAVYGALLTKQNTISLTTTGTSGAATFDGATLNIPQYAGGTSFWTYLSGLLYPNNTTDNVLLGKTTSTGSEYVLQTARASYFSSSNNSYSPIVAEQTGSTGSAASFTSVGGQATVNYINPSSNNTAVEIHKHRRSTSSVSNGAVGIGLRETYESEDNAGTNVTIGYFQAQFSDVVAGTVDGKFSWWLTSNGSGPSEAMSLSSLGDLSVLGGITSTGGKIGYGSGTGGTVTQLTSKATGVTLNTLCGQITTFSAALAAAAEATFTVTNSQVAANDVIIVNHKSGGTNGAYLVSVSAVSAGSFSITYSNVSSASKTEAPVFSFVVIKGA